MSEQCVRRLSSFCGERVGSGFLGSVFYTDSGFTKVHSSPEIRAAFSADEVDRLVARARAIHRALVEASRIGSSLGEPQSVVTQFEQFFTIQLPMSDRDGVVLLFSRDVGRNLSTFVDECRSFVGDDADSAAT
jgi:hypothetical protein